MIAKSATIYQTELGPMREVISSTQRDKTSGSE
jgi:hypothetical protein